MDLQHEPSVFRTLVDAGPGVLLDESAAWATVSVNRGSPDGSAQGNGENEKKDFCFHEMNRWLVVH